MSDSEPGGAPACFICRCEEVTAEQLESAIALGAGTLNDLKRRTRAAMGLCQGTYCLGEMARMLAAHQGVQVGEIAPMTFRPPARGVSVDALSRNTD